MGVDSMINKKSAYTNSAMEMEFTIRAGSVKNSTAVWSIAVHKGYHTLEMESTKVEVGDKTTKFVDDGDDKKTDGMKENIGLEAHDYNVDELMGQEAHEYNSDDCAFDETNKKNAKSGEDEPALP